MKFEIGDMVKITEGTPYAVMIGMIGKIVAIDRFEDYVGIVIDGFKGHDLGGIIKENNGFWVDKSNIKIAKNNNKINY